LIVPPLTIGAVTVPEGPIDATSVFASFLTLNRFADCEAAPLTIAATVAAVPAVKVDDDVPSTPGVERRPVTDTDARTTDPADRTSRRFAVCPEAASSFTGT
jgi:hypothetical protein